MTDTLDDNNCVRGNLPEEEDLPIVDFKDIPRYKDSNKFNYDTETLTKRKMEIDAAIKLYPNLPAAWVEMAWDSIKQMPEGEMERIMKNKEWENTKPKERPEPSTLKNISIENTDKFI